MWKTDSYIKGSAHFKRLYIKKIEPLPFFLEPRGEKKQRCVILVESSTEVGNHYMIVLPHINVQYKEATLEMLYWYTPGSTSQVSQ